MSWNCVKYWQVLETPHMPLIRNGRSTAARTFISDGKVRQSWVPESFTGGNSGQCDIHNIIQWVLNGLKICWFWNLLVYNLSLIEISIHWETLQCLLAQWRYLQVLAVIPQAPLCVLLQLTKVELCNNYQRNYVFVWNNHWSEERVGSITLTANNSRRLSKISCKFRITKETLKGN